MFSRRTALIGIIIILLLFTIVVGSVLLPWQTTSSPATPNDKLAEILTRA